MQPRAGGTTPKRVLADIAAVVCGNLRTSGNNVIFDVVMLAVCLVAFEVNQHVVKAMLAPAHEGALALLAAGHANDFLGGAAFLAYVNLLLDIVKPEVRLHRLAPCVVFILLCGLFWEFVAPHFVAGSVCDPLDLVAYALGGTLYWALGRLFKRVPAGSGWPS